MGPDSATFLEACRLEWQRLGLPRDRLAVMFAELSAALEREDALPAEVGGIATGDPRAFADAWARERGVTRPRLEYSTGGRANRRRIGVLVLVALFALGGIAAALEFSSPDSGSDQGTDTTQTSFATPDLVTVPNLVGSPLEIATSTAQRVGVRIGDVQKLAAGTKIEPGTVLREQPPAGTRIRRGVTITLVVAG